MCSSDLLVDIAADVEQVLITAAVDGDLPANLSSSVATRHGITVRDTAQGRISVLEEGTDD